MTVTGPGGPESPLGDARRGLRGVGSELEDLHCGLVDVAGRPAPTGHRRPKLLGGFDPLLHGWVDRTPVPGGNQSIVTSMESRTTRSRSPGSRIFKPFALVDGRAVAVWDMPGGRFALEPFGRIAAPVLADRNREARDVERFLAAPH